MATDRAFYAVTADRSHSFDDLCVAVFEEVTATVMPRLRAGAMSP